MKKKLFIQPKIEISMFLTKDVLGLSTYDMSREWDPIGGNL